MDFLLVLIIAIPTLSALSYFSKFFKMTTLLSACLTVVLSLLLNSLHYADTGFFLLDGLNKLLLVTIASVYLLSSIYASVYHGHLVLSKELRLHMTLINLFSATMFFTVTINNYGLLWIGVEATTVSSALLLVIEKGFTALEAAWRYIIIVSTGLTIGLIAIILIYYNFHSLTISYLLSAKRSANAVLELAGGAALIGFGTKVGLSPMHTWLPDAHSEAPAEVSAMFSGVLLPVALYSLYRFYQLVVDPRITMLYEFFALLTVVTAAILLPSQRNYKRMFAYSTMENIGTAMLGFILGGPAEAGAMLLIVSHAFGKASAFYSSGNILERFKTKHIDEVKGLKDSMPITGVTLGLSALSVTGAPPFGVFMGELLIIFTLITLHLYSAAFILVASLFISFSSVNYKVSKMLFGEHDVEKSEAKRGQLLVALASIGLSLAVTVVYLVT
jgi:hydrogenase-4 component F